MVRKEEEEEEEEGEREGGNQKGMFSFSNHGFWMSRVLVWRLVAPCSRVLWKRSPKA